MSKFIGNITFEKVYFFIVFLFAARATFLTSNLDFRVNPIGFILLVFPSLFLLRKHRISLIYGRIGIVWLVLTIWVILRFFIDKEFNIFTYYVMYIQLLVCFVVINVYKENILIYFERITVVLAMIAIIFWGIMQVVGVEMVASLGFMEPSSSISSASLLIFNTPQFISDVEGIGGLTRNCGFAWEPGLFACFLVLAMFFNLCREKKIKGNRSLYILMLALISTSSTTGYIAFLFVVCNYFFLQKNRFKYKIPILIILVPIVIWISQLSFMSDKIKDTSTFDNFLSQNETSVSYFEENESQMVVQRFEGFYLDYLNFINDPIIGYGYRGNSYSALNISAYLIPADGIMSLFAQFGIFIGFLIFYIYYKSALLYDNRYNQKYKMLFVLYLIISFSYNFNFVAMFMAIWWYGFLLQPKKCNLK